IRRASSVRPGIDHRSRRRLDGGQGRARAAGAYDAINFPRPLGGAALQGVVGEFVKKTLPYTEADSNCLTYQVLAALGNILGKRIYAQFGTDRHYPNIFVLTVGDTNSGKGQGSSAVRAFTELVDEQWSKNRVRWGAASGEALVSMTAETSDKRVMLTAPEMMVLLTNADREGSNLSGMMRSAYDGTPLENNKARNSVRVPDHLISIIGHITPYELSTMMNEVDWSNGVANRFLWDCVKRHQILPRMTES